MSDTSEEFKAIKDLNDAAYRAFGAVRGKVGEEYLERLKTLMWKTNDLVDDLRLHRVSRANQR